MDQRNICILVLALVAVAPGARGADRWTMAETRSGKEPKTVSYQRIDWGADGQSLVCRKERRTQTTLVDPAGVTRGWKRTDAAGLSVELAREGREFVSRSAEGTARFPSGELPWIQDLNQLGRFVLGPDRELRFTAFADFLDARLKASDMTVFKATKVRQESQTWGSGSGPAWRVRVTFDDLRSAFWGADYWFRLSDGQLVRYEEVRGGPGTPVTVGVLVSEDL